MKNVSMIKIESITLLSIKEYKKYQEKIKPIDNWWWLRSPGFLIYSVANVGRDGSIDEYGNLADGPGGSVRPMLTVKNGPEIGETFVFGNKSWTMISKDMALCDESFCKMPFRKNWQVTNAYDYEYSDIKQYLNNWLEKNNIDF